MSDMTDSLSSFSDDAAAFGLIPVPRYGRPVHRYAPSPTGDLHLGNLRTALDAWRAARAERAVFILRIEDIDRPRLVPGSVERMLEDLSWLGLDWDEGPDPVGGPAGPYLQSRRDEIYTRALGALIAMGRAYPCRCSRKDLREASAPHGPEGPIYPGTCRTGDGAVLHGAETDETEVSWRFRVHDECVTEFTDLVSGNQKWRLDRLCGDFVIRRRDGLWAYQLACAVDDALMGVTTVTRGEDLLTSTPRQIEILRALGLPVPRYRHIPLVADAETGGRMCKRDGSLSVRSLRARGLGRDDVLELIERLPFVR